MGIGRCSDLVVQVWVISHSQSEICSEPTSGQHHCATLNNVFRLGLFICQPQCELVFFKPVQSYGTRHKPGFNTKLTTAFMQLEDIASGSHVSERCNASRMHTTVGAENIRRKTHALRLQPIESFTGFFRNETNELFVNRAPRYPGVSYKLINRINDTLCRLTFLIHKSNGSACQGRVSADQRRLVNHHDSLGSGKFRGKRRTMTGQSCADNDHIVNRHLHAFRRP